MKLLLDSCVWGPASEPLRDNGHDVVWAGSWDRDPGDREILRLAHQEGRVLITLDKDFGELAIVHGEAHAGIVRLVGFAAREQGPACLALLERHGEELRRGGMVTADPLRVRIRSALPTS